MQAEIAKKKPGPKPSGIAKVVYYRRVRPEQLVALDAVLGAVNSAGVPKTALRPVDVCPPVVPPPDTSQVKALLEDVERLTKEVEDLKGRLERCARATDDQKARYWQLRALEAETKLAGRGEFDQGG